MLAKVLTDLLRPSRVVHAHCDLPCGVYDPAQARIEAESVMGIQKKYQDAEGQKLLDLIAEIDKIFWETKGGKPKAA